MDPRFLVGLSDNQNRTLESSSLKLESMNKSLGTKVHCTLLYLTRLMPFVSKEDFMQTRGHKSEIKSSISCSRTLMVLRLWITFLWLEWPTERISSIRLFSGQDVSRSTSKLDYLLRKGDFRFCKFIPNSC